MNKTRILFLCTGNSCRSQMAEGWARHLKADTLDVVSAGTHPSHVHSLAIQVMREAGVDISSYRSKSVAEFVDQEFDYVITLCSYAHESCPFFPGKTKAVHREFDDPTSDGDEESVLSEFRRVRDEIRAFVEGLPDNIMEEN